MLVVPLQLKIVLLKDVLVVLPPQEDKKAHLAELEIQHLRPKDVLVVVQGLDRPVTARLSNVIAGENAPEPRKEIPPLPRQATSLAPSPSRMKQIWSSKSMTNKHDALAPSHVSPVQVM